MSTLVVGTITLDIIQLWNQSKTDCTLEIGFGGVCKNVACVLGTLQMEVNFVSTNFIGDVGQSVEKFLNDNNVIWSPLPYGTPLSLYQAHVDASGTVFQEDFVDSGSLALLTPATIEEADRELTECSVVVSCTDLTATSLDKLNEYCEQKDIPFWLLVSSILEVEKLLTINKRPDFIGMNLSEIQQLHHKEYSNLAEIAVDARNLANNSGYCLVTLGSKGALLTEPDSEFFLFQPTTAIQNLSPVGAGDVLFSAILAYVHKENLPWDEALHKATQRTASYIKRDRTVYPMYITILKEQIIPDVIRIGYADTSYAI